MPKLTWRGLSLLFFVCLLASVPARAFDEGIDYRTLPQPQATESDGKVEVLELFWYGCPHCFHLEPKIENWLDSKPDYVVFRRMPAVLGRGWAPLGRAYFAAELLGVAERLHERLFVAVQEQHLRLQTPAQIADWFASQGVDREEFLKAYKSFIVDMRVRRSGLMARQMGIDGVPTLVVNGKYVTSPSMTASADRAFEVIDALAAREAGVAPPAAVEPAVAEEGGEQVEAVVAPAAPVEAVQGESEANGSAGSEAYPVAAGEGMSAKE